MATISKSIVDKNLRDTVFEMLFYDEVQEKNDTGFFHKINDRQYGIIMVDLNGHQRYVRIGAIVAEERDDMTAEELMQSEIEEYEMKQKAKEEKAKAKEQKIAKDKARREKEKE